MKAIRAACGLLALALTSVSAADLSAAKITEAGSAVWVRTAQAATYLRWPVRLRCGVESCYFTNYLAVKCRRCRWEEISNSSGE